MNEVMNNSLMVLCVLLFMSDASGMDPMYNGLVSRDVDNKIIICSENATKNVLARTCRVLHELSSKNNCVLYMHSPFVLNMRQQTYALLYSTYRGNELVVKNLLENGVDSRWAFDEFDILPCTIAEYKNNRSLLKILTEAGGYGERLMCPLFVLAVYLGDLELLNQCINDGFFDVCYSNRFCVSLLYLAAQNAHEHIMRRLLEYPAVEDIINRSCYKGATALYNAARNGHVGIVELLLAVPSIDVDRGYNGWSPLCAAVKHGHYCVAKTLLTHPGIDVNLLSPGCEGQSALHFAVEYNDEDLIKLLLASRKTNPNIYDYLGSTPLNYAIERNNAEIKSLLIAGGALF